jgi:hypothetical protein
MSLIFYQKRSNYFKLCLYVLIIIISFIFTQCGGGIESTVPARAFLYSNEEPDSTSSIVGYLLFTHRPDTLELPRYTHIYNSFINNFESLQSYKLKGAKNIATTYWLLEMNENRPDVIKNYDYARAQIFCSQIERLGKKGPILMAYNNRLHNYNSGNSVLLLDLSNFSDEDIDRAFRIWKERIVMEPDKWKDGFLLVIIKENFRSLVQSYGENIISILNKIF